MLTEKSIPIIVCAFTQIGWNKPASIYQHYLQEQEGNQRSIWIAFNRNCKPLGRKRPSFNKF